MSAEMPKLRLDIPVLLERSWKVFMEAPSVYVTAGIVFLVVGVVAGVLGTVLGAIPFLGILLSFALALGAAVAYGALFVGLLGMARGGIRGSRPKFEDLFAGFGSGTLVPAAIATAIITFITWIGVFLCVLPAFVIAAVYLHTWRFILEGERDFWAAMEASRKLVFNDPGTWAMVFVVVLGLKLVGIALCGVGLVVTIPIIALFLSAAYEEGLAGTASVETTEIPEVPAE